MSEHERLLEGAREWLEAARSERAAGRNHVAFEAARHAAVLASKAMLVKAGQDYPEQHAIAGKLSQHSLVPPGVKARDLQKLLSRFTLGTYGFEQEIREADVNEALRLAERLLADAQSQP